MLSIEKIIKGALSELKTHPVLTLGFSLFWVWVWSTVQSSFLNSGRFFSALPGKTSWVIPLAAYGITFLLLGILYRRVRFVPQSMVYLIAFPLLASFGVASCALFSLFPTTNTTVTTILVGSGAIIMGATTACLHMEWGRLFGRLGPRKTIIHGAFGTFGAMLLVLSISLLPDSLAWIVIALIPIGCMAMILIQRRSLSVAETGEDQHELFTPWRFLITSFIQGAAFGILQAILSVEISATTTTTISVSGSLIGALLVFIVALFVRLDFNQLIYQVGFVILAASFALMSQAGTLFIGGWALNAIGYRFIDILMWALCVYLIKQRKLPTNWVFAITTCALLLGQLFGAVMGLLIPLAFPSQENGLQMLSVFMVFAILTGALLMANSSNLQKGWGMIRPGAGDDQTDDMRLRCLLATDGFELTTREFEVFVLLAEGSNKVHISEKLFLSKETVKTHTRNIYRKTDIHSQEELVALVARQARLEGSTAKNTAKNSTKDTQSSPA
jgi:DNA-binding CsgD family transcriptional regulator